MLQRLGPAVVTSSTNTANTNTNSNNTNTANNNTNSNNTNTANNNNQQQQQQQPQQQPFRFVSYNAPNLHLVENQDGSLDRAVPTQGEQADAILSVAQTGGRVIRIYSLGIVDPNVSTSPLPFHISSLPATEDEVWLRIPGSANPPLYFNRKLLIALDSAIYLSGVYRTKLIIPFIDRWGWWGGIAAFSNIHSLKSPDEFYTDSTCIANFKSIITFLMLRNNSFSGILYKDDPVILAWETGNELEMPVKGGRIPSDWTIDIAKHTKNFNTSQLVMDGSFSIHGFDEKVLLSDSIDGFSGHYYNFVPPPAQFLSLGLFISCFILSILSLALTWKYQHKFTCFQKRFPSNVRKMSNEVLLENRSPFREISEFNEPYPKNRSIGFKFTLSSGLFLCLILSSITFLALSIRSAVYISLHNGPKSIAQKFEEDCNLVTSYNKIFYIGEFGLIPLQNMEEILASFIQSKAMGALIWSLRSHSRDGGFYVHHEIDSYYSYHFPGFDTFDNRPTNERQVVSLISDYAQRIALPSNSTYQDLTHVNSTPMIPPMILTDLITVPCPYTINSLPLKWTGSAGASDYMIERAISGANESSSLIYTTVAEKVQDNCRQGCIPFNDTQISVSANVWYRVTGRNSFGAGVRGVARQVVACRSP